MEKFLFVNEVFLCKMMAEVWFLLQGDNNLNGGGLLIFEDDLIDLCSLKKIESWLDLINAVERAALPVKNRRDQVEEEAVLHV